MSTTLEKPPVKSPARGLGKGLSALMGDAPYDPPRPARERKAPRGDGAVFSVPLDAIEPGKFQPRDHFDQVALLELADSVRKNGVIQPILVREGADGKYEIVAGERRWRAASMAGLHEIPVILREFSDKKTLEVALVENVQREGLNPLEEAGGYQRLMSDFGYTQEALSMVVHKSRSHIANLLRLLELPDDIRQLLSENKLTMGHARALAGVPDAIAIAQQVIDKGLSVRQVEKLARLGKEPSPYRLRRQREKDAEQQLAQLSPLPAPAPAAPAPAQPAMQQAAAPQRAATHRDPDIMALEETLSENLGLKVSINDRGQSGDITVYYDSLEQLDDVLRRLGGSI